MTCSTAIVGSAARICDTTFALGAGEKPSIVSACTASSLTGEWAATAAEAPPACSSSATPDAITLSLRSTMMRCAVFRPMPFTPFSTRSSPLAITLHSSFGDRLDRIMRAVLAPTPLTVMSIW